MPNTDIWESFKGKFEACHGPQKSNLEALPILKKKIKKKSIWE